MKTTTYHLGVVFGLLVLCFPNFYATPSPSESLFLSSGKSYNAPNEDFELHINCGGERLVQQGVTFEADQYYYGDTKRYINPAVSTIKNTTDDALYLTERSLNETAESFGYEIQVPNGIYEVKLHFAEIYWGAPGGGSGGAGKRNFSVALEKQWLLSNYDIVADVGSMTAVVKSFTVAVADGTMNIDLYGNVDKPKLSAFELFYKGETDLPEVQDFNWEEEAASPTNKIEPQCVQVDDKMFLFSGFTNGYQIVDATEIYEPAANSWSLGTPVPHPLTHAATAVIDGEVWLIGGFTGDDPGAGTDLVQIYNIAEDSWREGPALPKKRGGGGVAFVNGKLHFFGGFYPDRDTNSGDHFVLDLANPGDGWQEDTPMPNPRGHLSAALIDGIIYAIGGQHGHDFEIEDQKSVHAYDPETHEWIEKQALPYARSHFEPGTFVYEGQIVIVGGRRGEHYFYDRITAYDPQTDVWREIGTLPEPTVGPSAKVFNDQLVVTNGGINGDWNPSGKTFATAFAPHRPSLRVETVESENDFIKIYPNPVTHILNLQLRKNAVSDPLEVEVVSALGKQVLYRNLQASTLRQEYALDVSGLKNGIYFVTVIQAKSKNSFKIIKN